MRGVFVLFAGLALLLGACGYSPEETAVRRAYNDLVDGFESGNYFAVFDMMSSNTRRFLDDFAVALDGAGLDMGSNGRELLSEMMAGSDMTGLSRQITTVTVTGGTALVTTETDEGDETTTFVLEDGEWRLDFEDFMKESIDMGLAGSGMTVDGILAGDFGTELNGGIDLTSGSGSCPVTIENGLGSWDIWYVYVSPATDDSWGDDRIGAENILSPGNTITVWVDPGTYDIMVEDVDEDTYSRYGVEVGPPGYEWVVTLSDMD